MAQQLVDKRDQEFVIWEQMVCEEITKLPPFRAFNKKTCDMILTEARTLAIKELHPTMKDGDEQGVQYTNGTVKVPESYHRAFNLIREGDWNNLSVDPEMGGQGGPGFLGMCVSEYLMAANWTLSCYTSMGIGTALLIHKYATPEDKEKYVRKLTAAQWGGTMLLTEPEAGSDVGALSTTAVKSPDGTYALTGNKIFITNGDHDLVENIIHPVLARIEGDPAGTKGLSLFIVPKYLVNEDGSLGERNDIVCAGIERKHGLHGSATTMMSIGGKGKCKGYLLGKPREGMKIMFYMINNARMKTGLQALSYASSAYLLAVNYARERIQGRDLENFADPAAPSVPIIRHPDVRRNLLWMKAYVTGMRSFFHYMTKCQTKAEWAENDTEKQTNAGIFNLLSPIVKEYLATKGYEVCVQAIQVHGGAGYTKDYLVEQYARDCRAVPIYEGTSGIQAMDFLARKIGADKGAAFNSLIDEIHLMVDRASDVGGLKTLSEKVANAAGRLADVCSYLTQLTRSSQIKVAFAHSLPFLHATGDVVVAWMHLWRSVIATERLKKESKQKNVAFYKGLIRTAEFFIETELEITLGKLNAIRGGCVAAVEIAEDEFGGL